MTVDYSELTQELAAAIKELDRLTRCPAQDDHDKIAQCAVHVFKLGAEIHAIAKLQAGN